MVRESGSGVMIFPPYFGYTVGSTPSAYALMESLKDTWNPFSREILVLSTNFLNAQSPFEDGIREVSYMV